MKKGQNLNLLFGIVSGILLAVTILVLSMDIFSYYTYQNSTTWEYLKENASYFDKYQSTTHIDRIQNQTAEMDATLRNTSASGSNSIFDLQERAFGALKMTLDTPSIVKEVVEVEDTGTSFQIPGLLVTFFVSILALLIILVIWAVVWQK
jgi:hypothetical protein